VVRFADQPGRTGAAVEAGHALAAGQSHGAVLAAKSRMTLALVVGDVIWIERYNNVLTQIRIEGHYAINKTLKLSYNKH